MKFELKTNPWEEGIKGFIYIYIYIYGKKKLNFLGVFLEFFWHKIN